MALPKLEHPIYELTVPSTKAKFKFRPYTVKEQKILLMLKESSEPDEIVKVLKELIGSCCLDKIPVNKLAYFDIEYLFLKIRAFSVGEIATLSYKCNNVIEDKKCGVVSSIDVDLNSIEIDFTNVKEKEIELENGIAIVMDYPNLDSSKLILEYKTSDDVGALVAATCNDINLIKDANKVYEEFTKEELTEFINALSLDSFQKIIDFYLSCPNLSKEILFTCKKCGYTENIILKGLRDFFG